jgi:hypothetical protein
MSKSRITKLFITAVIACITGGILVTLGWFAFPEDVFVKKGSEIVGIQGTAFASTMLALGAIGAVALVGAAFAGLASWIGALLNTSALERKTWFIALAVLQVLNLGLLAVLAYVVAGPDRPRQTTVDTSTPVTAS